VGLLNCERKCDRRVKPPNHFDLFQILAHTCGMNTLVLEVEPIAVEVAVTDENLVVYLADGRSLTIPLEWYPRLAYGSPEERQNWQLLGDGYTIEWPDLDEHIGIEGLLAGRRSGESKKSLERWLSGRSTKLPPQRAA
jgi:hypothetical protein